MSRAHYDDPAFSYEKYWHKRGYEDQSERQALTFLLKNSRFSSAVDIGGGFGRLTQLLFDYSPKVSLVEPSAKQRLLAKKYLSGLTGLNIVPGRAEKLPFKDAVFSLALMVRVLHHLPDPQPAVSEISRILNPGGTLILEYANSRNFKSRFISFLTGRPILLTPVEKRSSANIRLNTIPFVNHHPLAIRRLLTNAGFEIIRSVSVSNFRSPFLKNILPLSVLLYLENLLRPVFSAMEFGPSIFVLARKVDKTENP